MQEHIEKNNTISDWIWPHCIWGPLLWYCKGTALGHKRVKSFYNRRAGNYNFQTILSVKITNVVRCYSCLSLSLLIISTRQKILSVEIRLRHDDFGQLKSCFIWKVTSMTIFLFFIKFPDFVDQMTNLIGNYCVIYQ